MSPFAFEQSLCVAPVCCKGLLSLAVSLSFFWMLLESWELDLLSFWNFRLWTLVCLLDFLKFWTFYGQTPLHVVPVRLALLAT